MVDPTQLSHIVEYITTSLVLTFIKGDNIKEQQ